MIDGRLRRPGRGGGDGGLALGMTRAEAFDALNILPEDLPAKGYIP